MSFLTAPLPLVISATPFLLLNTSRNGDRETLNSLIGKAEDTKIFARCLCLAAENGHLECVKTLVSFTEPKMFFWVGWGVKNQQTQPRCPCMFPPGGARRTGFFLYKHTLLRFDDARFL